MGSPVALSFLAQAVASSSLSMVQLHWISADQGHAVAWSVLLLTVPLQGLAAAMAFVTRDSVVATSAGLLAGAWAATAVVVLTSPPGSTSAGLGVVLLAVGVALLVPAAAGVTRLAAFVVVLLSATRFTVTGIHELTASSAWQSAAGWVGLVLAAASVYGALAFELSSSLGADVLPVGRLQLAEAR